MRYLIILALLASLHGAESPPDMPTAAETLQADVEAAVQRYIAATDNLIAAARSRGQHAQAAELLAERDATVAAHRPAVPRLRAGAGIEETVDQEPEPIVVDTRLLRSLFKARASVDRDGVVRLMYDFRRPDQAQDFEFRIQDARIERGTLVLGAQEVMRHAAQWTGPITVRTAIAFGGWDGQYMSLGNARVSGSNYNAWSVRLGDQRALFHRRYQLTGDITDYRQLQLILDDHRSLLTYGMFENAPVSVATSATPIKRASLSVFGGSAGAAMRGLFIQGTLDQDWLREQLIGQE